MDVPPFWGVFSCMDTDTFLSIAVSSGIVLGTLFFVQWALKVSS